MTYTFQIICRYIPTLWCTSRETHWKIMLHINYWRIRWIPQTWFALGDLTIKCSAVIYSFRCLAHSLELHRCTCKLVSQPTPNIVSKEWSHYEFMLQALWLQIWIPLLFMINTWVVDILNFEPKYLFLANPRWPPRIFVSYKKVHYSLSFGPNLMILTLILRFSNVINQIITTEMWYSKTLYSYEELYSKNILKTGRNFMKH